MKNQTGLIPGNPRVRREVLSGGVANNLWRTGWIVLSSVALGGLALVLWNRKGIDSMHRTRAEDGGLPKSPD